MSQQISEAVRSLERAKEKASKRLSEIDRERSEIKTSLKSLEMALKALGASELSRPAPTTSIVVESITNILSSRQELSIDELLNVVGEDLAGRGKSRAGLKLRLSQALRDDRFSVVDGNVVLRRDASTEDNADDDH